MKNKMLETIPNRWDFARNEYVKKRRCGKNPCPSEISLGWDQIRLRQASTSTSGCWRRWPAGQVTPQSTPEGVLFPCGAKGALYTVYWFSLFFSTLRQKRLKWQVIILCHQIKKLFRLFPYPCQHPSGEICRSTTPIVKNPIMWIPIVFSATQIQVPSWPSSYWVILLVSRTTIGYKAVSGWHGVPGAIRAYKSVYNRRWVEKREWEEMAVATADTRLIRDAIIMYGHERTVSWRRGWLPLSWMRSMWDCLQTTQICHMRLTNVISMGKILRFSNTRSKC